MGVPSFFRWLQERFPKCIVDCVERAGRGKDDDGQVVVCVWFRVGKEQQVLIV